LAAVEATAWAMDGTVNWASREEGRPARTIGAASLAEADNGAEGVATASGLPDLDGAAALALAFAEDLTDLAATFGVVFAEGVLTFFTTGLTFFAAAALAGVLTGALDLAVLLAKTLAGCFLSGGFVVNGFLLVGLVVLTDLAIGLAFAIGLLPDLAGDLALTAVNGFTDLVFTVGLPADFTIGLALGVGLLLATLAAGLALTLAFALATLAAGFLLTALDGAALALVDLVGLTGLAFTWELLAG
jgi:hypothetical protein